MGLPNIGPLELIIILAVLLLVVGPRRLPEMGQAFGRTIREFRKASTEMTDVATIATDPRRSRRRLRPPRCQPRLSLPPMPQPLRMLPRRCRPPQLRRSLVSQLRAAPLQPESPAPDPGTDTTDDASRQA